MNRNGGKCGLGRVPDCPRIDRQPAVLLRQEQSVFKEALVTAQFDQARRSTGNRQQASPVSVFDIDQLYASSHATAASNKVDWDSDHSGWSGLLSSGSKTRGGTKLTDFVSSVLKDDDGATKPKTGSNETQPRSSSPGLVAKKVTDKGWFDL